MLPVHGKKGQLIGTERTTKCGHRSETRIYLGRFSGYYLLRNRGFVRTDQSIFIKSGILHGVVILRDVPGGKLSGFSQKCRCLMLLERGAEEWWGKTRTSKVRSLSLQQQRHLQLAQQKLGGCSPAADGESSNTLK